MPERLSFNLNVQKTVEVILWISSKNPGSVGIYQILKTLFFADVFHLNRYGRPITGDDYAAMLYGPVASFCYDVLKMNELATAQVSEIPFKRDGKFVVPDRPANSRFLSKSDVEALEYGWSKCKDGNFGKIKDESHEHPAYDRTWSKRTTDADLMNFEDFIDEEHKSQLIDLKENGPNIQI